MVVTITKHLAYYVLSLKNLKMLLFVITKHQARNIVTKAAPIKIINCLGLKSNLPSIVFTLAQFRGKREHIHHTCQKESKAQKNIQ